VIVRLICKGKLVTHAGHRKGWRWRWWQLVVAVPVVVFLSLAAVLLHYKWCTDRAIKAILAKHGEADHLLTNASLACDDEELKPLLELLIAARGPDRLGLRIRASDKSMPLVGQMTWLKALSLACPGVTDEGLRHLTRLKRLRRLHLGKQEVGGNTRASAAVTDKGLPYIAQFKGLEHLNLAGTAVTDEGIQVLAALPALRDLQVFGANVTAEGLERLVGKSPSLQNPEMRKWIAGLRKRMVLQTDDQTARPALARLIQLRQPTESLFLEGHGMTDRSLELVGRMTWLRELKLHDTAVTDQGLADVAQIKSLETLELRAAKVCDDGIQVLAGLPALRKLYVLRCNVTADGLERLVAKLPGLANPEMQKRIERLRESISLATDDQSARPALERLIQL